MIHAYLGAITVSEQLTRIQVKMVGGSFDYHPKQQEMHLKEVALAILWLQAFNGQGFTL